MSQSDEEAFLRAIKIAPEDEAVRGAFADWLEDQGRPAESLTVRRTITASKEWKSTGGKMTGDDFSKGIVGQDDDQDYEESGWVAAVLGDRAFIGHYSHCSCYGTWESLCSGGISDYFQGDETKQPTWNWVGTPDELVDMAGRTADPSLPWRAATADDWDYDHLTNMYQQILDWDKNGRKLPVPA